MQNSRSKCVSCEHLRVPCEFKPTPKQVEVAQKKATQDADPFVGYPGPVETAPARERNSRGPRRTILPRPQAPAPGYASSTAGSEVQPQYPEQPDSSFGGIATGSQALPESPDGYNGGFGGFTAGPDAQYPRLLDMGFGGLDQRSKRSSQRPQEPSAGYGGFDPRVNEYWQRRRAPESAFEESYNRPYASPHLGTQQDDFTQWSQQPAPEYGGHSNTTIGDSSVLGGYPPTPRGHPSAFGEPNFAFGGSPVGTSPYAIDPAVGFRGPPPPYGDLPRPPEWRRTRRE